MFDNTIDQAWIRTYKDCQRIFRRTFLGRDRIVSIYSRLKLYFYANIIILFRRKFKCRDNCFFRKLLFIIPRVKGASHAVLTFIARA